MDHNVYSLKARYAFGSVAIGLCLIALGVARMFFAGGMLTLGVAVCLLLVSTLFLGVSFSPRRESTDEMYEAHDGRAAGHALRITLTVAGLVCIMGMVTNVKVDLAAVGLGLIGFGLLTYGIVFGWLER